MLQKTFKPYEKKYWALVFLVATYLFINTAWVSEDAFITFRVVENLLDGHGPVYNLGERVQVYTHPLWFFLLVAGRALGLDLYYFSLGLSYVIFIASLGLFLGLAQRRQVPLPLTLALLLLASLSRSFIDYASSGLENGLLVLEYLLFIGIVSDEALPRRRKYFGALLLYGLIFLTRPDGVVLLTPALLPLLIQMVRGEKGWLSLGFLALYPFILWEIFSLFYYGSPTPNTALAKLNIDYPREILVLNGLDYLFANYFFDAVTSTVLYLGLLAGLCRRGSRLLALGLLLYLVYVVMIGADYMVGRFFSAPFLVALLMLAWTLGPLDWSRFAALGRFQYREALLILLAAAICRYSDNYHWSGRKNYRSNVPRFFYGTLGISDERFWYIDSTGLLAVLLENNGNYLKHKRLQDFSNINNRIVFACDIGLFGYVLNRNNHIIDPIALSEPFLARLPARNSRTRIGHYERAFPPGYVLSQIRGRNLLASPKLRQLYDDVQWVTRGPLLSGKRFGAIWRLNSGHYKNLDQEFDRNDINMREVGFETGTPNHLNCIGSNQRVHLPKPLSRNTP